MVFSVPKRLRRDNGKRRYLATFDIECDPRHKNIKQYGPDMPIIKKGWDIKKILKLAAKYYSTSCIFLFFIGYRSHNIMAAKY